MERTLPQGWKESSYIYRTLGSVTTNTLKELGLSCSQYIDDRHLGELWGSVEKRPSSLEAVNAAFFAATTILTQLGYYLHLDKCVPFPTQRLIFFDHLVDTTRQTFSIPEDNNGKFIALREGMRSSTFVTLNELQHFQGKCMSLTLMVPAVGHAISRCQKQGTPIPLDGKLGEEILHWRFLETWTGFVPWRTEEHKVQKTIASDASQTPLGSNTVSTKRRRVGRRLFWPGHGRKRHPNKRSPRPPLQPSLSSKLTPVVLLIYFQQHPQHYTVWKPVLQMECQNCFAPNDRPELWDSKEK